MKLIHIIYYKLNNLFSQDYKKIDICDIIKAYIVFRLRYKVGYCYENRKL